MNRRHFFTLACAALANAEGESTAWAAPSQQALTVLHWWTSDGERKAADALAKVLAQHDVLWRDAAVPGGAGVAAVKVLNSRILMGDPPDMAQLIGSNLIDWANAGLVMPIGSAQQEPPWLREIFPRVREQISHHGSPIAAPLGIHRINNLYVHRALFERYDLAIPRTWDEVLAAATVFKRHGIEPLAWSDQPWQIATIFESMLAGDVGAATYRDLMVKRMAPTWITPQVGTTLKRMVKLREEAAIRPHERDWTDAARALLEGRAAMMIMGDWVGGEMCAWAPDWEKHFRVVTVPETARFHVYSLDSLAMLKTNRPQPAAGQWHIANLLTSLEAQYAYNNAKGSVPVRIDTDIKRLTACGQASWGDFSSRKIRRLPSLAHRMAATESIKDTVARLVWQFTTGIQPNLRRTQEHLATAVRALDANS